MLEQRRPAAANEEVQMKRTCVCIAGFIFQRSFTALRLTDCALVKRLVNTVLILCSASDAVPGAAATTATVISLSSDEYVALACAALPLVSNPLFG